MIHNESVVDTRHKPIPTTPNQLILVKNDDFNIYTSPLLFA